MRALVLGSLLALSAVAHAATDPDAAFPPASVDYKVGRPMLFQFDSAPGYYDSVRLPLGTEAEDIQHVAFQLSPPHEPVDWTSQKWSPSGFVCLRLAASDKTTYCVNISRDIALGRNYGVARLMTDGEQMFRKTTKATFDPTLPIDVQVVRKGQHVTATVAGEVIDEGDIGFDADEWTLGGSTGTMQIRVFVDPPAP